MKVGSIYSVLMHDGKRYKGVCVIQDDGGDFESEEIAPSWRIDFPNGGCKWVTQLAEQNGTVKKLFLLFNLPTYFRVRR